jgi:hypothetical protein
MENVFAFRSCLEADGWKFAKRRVERQVMLPYDIGDGVEAMTGIIGIS